MLFLSKTLKQNFESFLVKFIQKYELGLVLNIIAIEPSQASLKYIQIKSKVAEKLGIQTRVFDIETKVLKGQIENITKEIEVKKEGLIFQLPVPLEFDKFVDDTSFFCDVDLLGNEAGKLWKMGFLPPTIGAIDLVLKSILLQSEDFELLVSENLDLKGKVVAVIGQGKLVGGPLLEYLKNAQATIISINAYTPGAKSLVQKADIVISAAGQKDLLDDNWFKEKAIVVDASTSESNGSLVGDVATEVYHSNIILSPSPGGIGRLTVLYLFWNLAKLKNLNTKI